MNQLEVRIVELEPMQVASAHGFGKNPEEQAWDKVLGWAKTEGLLDGPYHPRFFGFNNPDPTPASPNYGYEQWITVAPDVSGNDEITIKEISGGMYAVTRFKGLSHIGRIWQELVAWVENSAYEMACQQCLEELLTPPGTPLEDFVFDLYLPVKK